MKLTLTNLSIFGALSLIALPAYAQGDYTFDESCAPTQQHASEQGTPDALVILDRSVSMDDPGGKDVNNNDVSKLELAKQAIRDLAAAAHEPGPCQPDGTGCDDVRVGLGWFSSSSGVNVLPAEDSKNDILATVNGYGTNGATATGEAAQRIYSSQQLRDAERVGLGIFITDGEPSIDSYPATHKTIEETLHYLCAARDEHDILTFMVGFGTGADPRMNSLFAAAGGTGKCCVSKSGVCDYQPNQLFDPCTALSRRNATQLDAFSPPLALVQDLNTLNPDVQCEGAKQADDGQALKDELLALIKQISCTFKLEVPPDYLRAPGADEDVYATRVAFDKLGPLTNVSIYPIDPSKPDAFYDYLTLQKGMDPIEADLYRNEGWIFADPLRRTVALTGKLCEDVNSDRVEVTETQVACLCANTGSGCNVLCTDDDGDGYDDYSGSLCDTDTAAEIVQTGRCKQGIVECIVGVEYCAALFSPQPDICNGLDDDCDGFVDNSSRANPAYDDTDPDDNVSIDSFEWNGNQSQLDMKGLDVNLFCGFQDFSCGCGLNGSHDFGESPLGSMSGPYHEWELLLQSTADQAGKCSCAPGLEPAAPLTTDSSGAPEQNADTRDNAATCSATPASPAAPVSLLLFMGMFVAFFKRKRS